MNCAVKLWRHKRIMRRTTVIRCFLLMMLSSAPLILTLMFSESMMNGISSKYISLSNGHIRVSDEAEEVRHLLDSSDISDYVYSYDEVIAGNVLMYSSSGTAGVSVKGVDENYFNDYRKSQISLTVADESCGREEKLKGIIISRYCAEKLKVKCSDHIALMIVPDSPSSTARPVMVYVKGIFSSGYDQLDKLISFMESDYAATLFTSDNSVMTEILLKAGCENRIDAVCSVLYGKLPFITWDKLNVSMYDNFAASRQFIFILILLIAVVASFFTASIAQQLIQDDISDIAVMKLIGMPDYLVKKWALTTVFSVTVSGIAAGSVIGTAAGMNMGSVLSWLASKNISSLSYYLLDFDVTVPYVNIGLTILFMMTVSFISILMSLRITRTITPIRLFNES